jgi:hypothetical protein
MGAREYSPMLGRWLSADSIVPDPANPQTLNRYSYVNNRPLNLVDPTGHCGRTPEGVELCPESSSTASIALIVDLPHVSSLVASGQSRPARVDPTGCGFDYGCQMLASGNAGGYLAFAGPVMAMPAIAAVASSPAAVAAGGTGTFACATNAGCPTKVYEASGAVGKLVPNLRILEKGFDPLKGGQNPGGCVRCAQQVFDKFQAAGENAQIWQIANPTIGTKTAPFLFWGKAEAASNGGFHQFVRVGNRVFDKLTGAKGMDFDEYIKHWQYLSELVLTQVQ